MINLGLERTSRLLQHISRKCFQQNDFNPSWKAAHIAGTNGKGSVAAYLASLLHLYGLNKHSETLRVGRFTSPHFIDRWDCIQINNKPVTKDAFLETERQVKAIAEHVEQELRDEAYANAGRVAEKDTKVTEFELLTATAFTMFSQHDPRPCDFAVIECGLGGRLDATNVLPTACIGASIITRIGIDHLDILGGSLESIVREKCGIFRSGVPVVVDGDNTTEILSMVKQHHQNINEAPFSSPNYCEIGAKSLSELVVYSPDVERLMPHQQANMAVAAQAFVQITGWKQAITATMTQTILKEAARSYPARLQVFHPGWASNADLDRLSRINAVPLILDGAHNPQSAEVLREFVDCYLYDQSNDQRRLVIWIIALSSTKPPAELLAALFPNQKSAHDNKLIFTSFGQVDGMPWVEAASPATLLDSALEQGLDSHATTTNDIRDALREADFLLAEAHRKQQNPIIVVAGSLYLASDFLRNAKLFK